MSEAVIRRHDGGRFVSLWELLSQIGQAEKIYENDAARYLVSSLESDPAGMNHIRRRESGIILPLNMGARLHLLQQLSIFAKQGTLLDTDGRPNDAAQPTFECFGFYASEIYSFLARNDVAVSRPSDEATEGRVFPDGRPIPSWIFTFDGKAWLSQRRAAKILIASTNDADLCPPQYDDVFDKWDEALTDAIDCDVIAVTKVARKQMLSHATIRAWCAQHGYVWPLKATDEQLADRPDNALLSGQQEQRADSASRSPREHNGGTTKREQQIRAIEEIADKLGYPRQQIPDGGKTELRKLCKSQHPDLFGGGDSPFNDAWKAASKVNRIAMANRNKFAGR